MSVKFITLSFQVTNWTLQRAVHFKSAVILSVSQLLMSLQNEKTWIVDMRSKHERPSQG
jgi:hypothetical protein